MDMTWAMGGVIPNNPELIVKVIKTLVGRDSYADKIYSRIGERLIRFGNIYVSYDEEEKVFSIIAGEPLNEDQIDDNLITVPIGRYLILYSCSDMDGETAEKIFSNWEV